MGIYFKSSYDNYILLWFFILIIADFFALNISLNSIKIF